EHELLVKKGKEEFRRYLFAVVGGDNPGIRVTDMRRGPADQTTVSGDGWVPFVTEANLSQAWEGLAEFWRLEKGLLIGGSAKSIPYNTFLCRKRNFGDFELKCKVKLTGDKANSGIQIRSPLIDRKKFTVRGPQADMGDIYWGSLYGELFGGLMQQAPEELV